MILSGVSVQLQPLLLTPYHNTCKKHYRGEEEKEERGEQKERGKRGEGRRGETKGRGVICKAIDSATTLTRKPTDKEDEKVERESLHDRPDQPLTFPPLQLLICSTSQDHHTHTHIHTQTEIKWKKSTAFGEILSSQTHSA